MTSLADAIDAVVAETETVALLREDMVIKQLLKSFKNAAFTHVDEPGILDELAAMAEQVTFSSKAFPLDGTAGIEQANKFRTKLQAVRERLVALDQDLRNTQVKTARVFRVGIVYLRQQDGVQGSTAKHTDDLCSVVLREIVELQETVKLLMDQVKETLSLVDGKTRSLDAWFSLHKQYVFMTANRGPRGEQETHDKASKGTPAGRLGRRRQRQYTEDDFED